jgi:hypothetical protein
MKQLMFLAAAAVAAASLGACAATYHGPGPYAGAYVDGYYDDAYGPFYDGYWGDGDAFYYRSGPTDGWHRDGGHHFRHDAGPGAPYHTFHARAGRAPDRG